MWNASDASDINNESTLYCLQRGMNGLPNRTAVSTVLCICAIVTDFDDVFVPRYFKVEKVMVYHASCLSKSCSHLKEPTIVATSSKSILAIATQQALLWPVGVISQRPATRGARTDSSVFLPCKHTWHFTSCWNNTRHMIGALVMWNGKDEAPPDGYRVTQSMLEMQATSGF